jgi:hypothetical protein
MRMLEIAKHPLFIEIPRSPNEIPGTHDESIQPRPDLPAHLRPAPITVRNGSIYMISRNVPGEGIRPGMVLLLSLRLAADVMAHDIYEIATEAQIARHLEEREEDRKRIAADDRRLRMANQAVENNINIPATPVQVNFTLPAGYKMIREDEVEEETKPMVKRRSRTKASDDEAINTVVNTLSEGT